MGIVGRYIDALSDEQRDRVIEATTLYDGYSFYDYDGCGCLVGTAERVSKRSGVTGDPINALLYQRSGCRHYPSARFPKLCRRFGKDRIVAACKARAAKGNAPTVIREIRDGLYQDHKDRVERDRLLVPVGGLSGRFPEHTR